MKVCILNDSWTPLWGGGPEHIWQISNLLVDKYSCEVDVIVPNLTDKTGKKYQKLETFYQEKFKVIRIGPKFIFPNLAGRLTFILASFWFCLCHRNYDIYHSQSFSTTVLLFPIRLLTGKKIVFTLHGAGIKGVGAGIFNHLSPLLIRIFLYLVPYDQLESASKSNILPEYQHKIVVIGNGVNINDFSPVHPRKNHQKTRILWVGREYDPVKGLAILKKAFIVVKKQIPQAQLIIVSNRLHQDVIDEYSKGDLFVLPSLSEGLPITLLEAMAAKLPVVASNVGDVPEVVIPGKTGYLTKPGDIKDLANKIISALKNPQLLKIGERGYALVREKYTWDQVAAIQYALYQKILQK